MRVYKCDRCREVQEDSKPEELVSITNGDEFELFSSCNASFRNWIFTPPPKASLDKPIPTDNDIPF